MDLQKILGDLETRMSEIQDKIDLTIEKVSEKESQLEFLQMELRELQYYFDRLEVTHKQLMRTIDQIGELGVIIDKEPTEF